MVAIEHLDRVQGWRCRLSEWMHGAVLWQHYDDEGYERGERLYGEICCPHCGLNWPLVDTPESWIENDDGTWKAEDWGPGHAECLECGAVFVDTFEGCFELKLK